MTPEGSLPRDTDIADFAEVLSEIGGEGEAVVVGGHAAGLWARYYLNRGVEELAGHLPFLSKDLDVVGTVRHLEALHHRFRGKLSRSEPRSPVIGRLDLDRLAGGTLRVEVLHMVLGLDAKDLARAVTIDAGPVSARVPLVHLVLKAKIANAAGIDQEGRQDVKHMVMLAICVREFIADLVEDCVAGGIDQRQLINVLNEIHEIVSSPVAARAEDRWQFDLQSVWPMEILRDRRLEKLSRWLEHRFPDARPT